MEKFVGRAVYLPDESIIIELREPVGQVVKSDRRNFLKFVVLEQRVLGQPVCRPDWIRVRQIKIVLRIIQHLNTTEQRGKDRSPTNPIYMYIYSHGSFGREIMYNGYEKYSRRHV